MNHESLVEATLDFSAILNDTSPRASRADDT